jgi:TIR domain-containing protein
MNGRNLFESRRRLAFGRRKVRAEPDLGVFISHSHLDKDKAREVAGVLQASKVDYYLDEEDEELQIADEHHNHGAVVQRIEAGLMACTHLLGLITENTKNSWWVPYEIGSATGHARNCAHLIDAEVKQLPSYIQTATIIPDRLALRDWLPKQRGRRSLATLLELTQLLAAACDYPEFIPDHRGIDELTFG